MACLDRKVFFNTDDLWQHALLEHVEIVPKDDEEGRRYRTTYEAESMSKRFVVADRVAHNHE